MKDEAPNASAMRTAWLVVALLVPVALLNYLDRQMLAAMKVSMMSDIPDIGTAANWGLVLGSFKWVYAILSPLGGYLSDRLNRRNVICASLLVWSAVTWYMGYVNSFNELLAARALMDSDVRNLGRLATFVGDIMPFDVGGVSKRGEWGVRGAVSATPQFSFALSGS